MEQHYWWLFALLQPFGFAFSTIIAQHFQKSGFSLVTVRSVAVAFFTLPFAFIVEAPTEWIFYVTAFTAAALAFVGDSLVLNSSAKYGAGTTSRLLPVSPLLGFAIWITAHPESFYKLFENPIIGLGIICSLISCAYAMTHLKKCDISKKALIYLIPVIVIFGINDYMNKTAQDNSGFWNGIVWYIIILSTTQFILGSLLHLKNKNFMSTVQDKKLIKAGLLIGACYFVAMVGRNLSMVYTANPAYTSIIAGATPLVIYVYHKIFNIEDKANVKAGLLFTASVLALIFFATYIK